jgi:hypothetical protein
MKRTIKNFFALFKQYYNRNRNKVYFLNWPKVLPVPAVMAVVEVLFVAVGTLAERLGRRTVEEFRFPISVFRQIVASHRSSPDICRTRTGRCSSKRSSPNP